MIKGTEKPNEYIVLSAHFDSWDGASGATDNGTGTITMMEAMRILKKVYPNPKRTIIVGHWGSEEQGLNGSRGLRRGSPGDRRRTSAPAGTRTTARAASPGSAPGPFTNAHRANLIRGCTRVPSSITGWVRLGGMAAPAGKRRHRPTAGPSSARRRAGATA